MHYMNLLIPLYRWLNTPELYKKMHFFTRESLPDEKVYSEIWTGKWAKGLAQYLEPGKKYVLIIGEEDKTPLSKSGKESYVSEFSLL
jgi:hypothetical protein